MKLTHKQVYVDDLEETLDDIMDEISTKDVVYYILEETCPEIGQDSHKVKAVLTPIDFDPMKYTEIQYQEKLEDGGAFRLPLQVLKDYEWNSQDMLTIKKIPNGFEVTRP